MTAILHCKSSLDGRDACKLGISVNQNQSTTYSSGFTSARELIVATALWDPVEPRPPTESGIILRDGGGESCVNAMIVTSGREEAMGRLYKGRS
jgi:hypothetical protein